MTPKQYYDSLLITDANTPIDKFKQHYSEMDLFKFAEAYHQFKMKTEVFEKMEIIIETQQRTATGSTIKNKRIKLKDKDVIEYEENGNTIIRTKKLVPGVFLDALGNPVGYKYVTKEEKKAFRDAEKELDRIMNRSVYR